MPPLLPSPSRRRTTAATSVGLAALLLTVAAPQVAQAAPPAPAATTAQAPAPTLSDVAARAAAALEAYQQAAQAQTDAQTAADAAQADLAVADAAVEARRTELGTWASQAYRGTTGMHQLSTVTALLDPQTTQDVGWTLAALDRVSGEYERAVEASEAARRTRATAAATAAAAVEQARTSAEAALAAKTSAEALVQQQLVAYAAAQRTSAGLDALTPDPAVVERARERLSTTATCTGATLSGYANGLLPVEALCPLYGAPGKVLRADAAHAFEGLSQAFEAQFGVPLAVTDAYRSLAEQVDVKARKPGLAAVPGTSRHGLGLAVDLGGGVQDANAVQHQWLDRNAALFGFVNPAWAQGSPGPFEPWHWEYVAL
ncbi:M15 family metallopeptidase [Kineococcus rhizosphaerae]|uniref:D-alanyl-D-alanine carboxypeptidase-like protein n=1 Tax=Kineococcus rhizosphaerae TaxID=559628 RepID=A0A2T0RAI7_9ACTN|nr:M15 family metallopeptidase [Kineococcus rhizosphaerae]PRY18177.1 D-alanyl-D-alanine carboxypeptidase-like protein [Kineococcus rhizosphaerae]